MVVRAPCKYLLLLTEHLSNTLPWTFVWFLDRGYDPRDKCNICEFINTYATQDILHILHIWWHIACIIYMQHIHTYICNIYIHMYIKVNSTSRKTHHSWIRPCEEYMILFLPRKKDFAFDCIFWSCPIACVGQFLNFRDSKTTSCHALWFLPVTLIVYWCKGVDHFWVVVQGWKATRWCRPVLGGCVRLKGYEMPCTVDSPFLTWWYLRHRRAPCLCSWQTTDVLLWPTFADHFDAFRRAQLHALIFQALQQLNN